ncbi:MAG: hypothetical protein IKE46_07310 [Selenomonadaceae bacterium]|nr:hypothetical protein [Selenomonadaceae bacterium]
MANTYNFQLTGLDSAILKVEYTEADTGNSSYHIQKNGDTENKYYVYATDGAGTLSLQELTPNDSGDITIGNNKYKLETGYTPANDVFTVTPEELEAPVTVTLSTKVLAIATGNSITISDITPDGDGNQYALAIDDADAPKWDNWTKTETTDEQGTTTKTYTATCSVGWIHPTEGTDTEKTINKTTEGSVTMSTTDSFADGAFTAVEGQNNQYTSTVITTAGTTATFKDGLFADNATGTANIETTGSVTVEADINLTTPKEIPEWIQESSSTTFTYMAGGQTSGNKFAGSDQVGYTYTRTIEVANTAQFQLVGFTSAPATDIVSGTGEANDPYIVALSGLTLPTEGKIELKNATGEATATNAKFDTTGVTTTAAKAAIDPSLVEDNNTSGKYTYTTEGNKEYWDQGDQTDTVTSLEYKGAVAGKAYTFTNLQSGLTIESVGDGKEIQVDNTGDNIKFTFSSDALNNGEFSVATTDGKNIEVALGDGVSESTTTPTNASVDNNNVLTYTAAQTTAGYVVPAAAQTVSVTYNAATTGGETFTATGLNFTSETSKETLLAAFNVDAENNLVTVSKSAIDTTKEQTITFADPKNAGFSFGFAIAETETGDAFTAKQVLAKDETTLPVTAAKLEAITTEETDDYTYTSTAVNDYVKKTKDDDTEWKYTPEVAATTLTITGLKSDITKVTVSDSTATGSAYDATTAGDVFVDLTGTTGPKVYLKAGALDTEHSPISVKNSSGAAVDVSIDTTTTADTTELVGTYDSSTEKHTVTLGKTSNYVYNENTKEYTWTTTGGEELKLTGLAADAVLTADMFDCDDDGKITFKPIDAVIAEGATKISVEAAEGTTVAIDTTDLTQGQLEAGAQWIQDTDDNNNPIAGKFTFYSAEYGKVWGKVTNTAAYYAEFQLKDKAGSKEPLITLENLTSDTTENQLNTAYGIPQPVDNGNLVPVYVEASESDTSATHKGNYCLIGYATYDTKTGKYDTSGVTDDKFRTLDSIAGLYPETDPPAYVLDQNKDKYYAVTTEGALATEETRPENFAVRLTSDTFDTATMTTEEGGTPVKATFNEFNASIKFMDAEKNVYSTNESEDVAAELTKNKDGTFNYVSKHKSSYITDTAGGNTHTYTFTDAVGKYGFTLSGLQVATSDITDGAVNDINKYFTFSTVEPQDGQGNPTGENVGVVTLTKAAFGNIDATNKTDNPTFITLSNIDLDGTDATSATAKDLDVMRLQLPAYNDDVETAEGTGFYYQESQATYQDATFTAAENTAADAKSATYTYKSAGHYGYFTIADDDHSIIYNGAEDATDLFTVSGLKAGGLTLGTDVVFAKDESGNAVFRVYKNALVDAAGNAIGEDLQLTPVEGNTATYNLDILTKAEYEAELAKYDGEQKEEYIAAFGDKYIPASLPLASSAKLDSGTLTFKPASATGGIYTEATTETKTTITFSEGPRDVLTFTGLNPEITGELTVIQEEDDLYTVSTKAVESKPATLLFTIKYTAAVADDPDTDVNESANAKYEVIPTAVALPADAKDINFTVTVVDTTPDDKTDDPTLTINDASFSNSLAADADEKFSLGTGDSASIWSYVSAGKTAGLDTASIESGATFKYYESTQSTFELTGIKTDDLTFAKGTEDALAALKKDGKTVLTIDSVASGDVINVSVNAGALDGKDLTLTDTKDDSKNYKLTLVTTGEDSIATTGELLKGGFTSVAEGEGFATYKTDSIASFYTAGEGTYASVTSFKYHNDVGGQTFNINGLKTDSISTDALDKAFTVTTTERTEKGTGEGAKDSVYTDFTFTVNNTDLFSTANNDVVSIGVAENLGEKEYQEDNYYGNYTFVLGSDVQGSVAALEAPPMSGEGKWSVESGKATFKTDTDAYYQIAHEKADDVTTPITSFTYKASVAGARQFALDGLAESVASIDTELAFKDGVVTISKASIAGADGLAIDNNDGKYAVDVAAAIKLTGTADGDTINVTADNASVDTGAGKDFINVAAAAFVNAGAGDDVITLGSAGASVNGGDGDDVINATAPGTVIWSAGNDSVNFVEGLKIQDAGAYTYSFDGNDVLVTKADGNTLLITGAKGQELNFVNGSVESATKLDVDASMFTFNAEGTSVSLNSSFVGASVGAHEYAVNNAAGTIVTVDASAYSIASGNAGFVIEGNANNNSIVGTKYADVIDGKEGNDTVTGGAGNDVFVYTAGNLTVTDFTSTAAKESVEAENIDSLKLGGDAAISLTAINGNDIGFTLNNGNKITLQDAFKTVDSVAVAVFDSAGAAVSNYTYGKDGYVLGDDSVTLLSNFANDKGYVAAANIKNIIAQNTAATSIDASAVTGGVSIDGSAAGGNTFIGGAGNDQFTGAEGKADTFVYTAGKDVVTNYESTTDKVLLGAGFDFAESLTGVAVTENASVGTVKLTFGSGELTFENISIPDSVTSSAININGKPYTFTTNTVTEGTTTTVLGSDVALKVADSITAVDASKANNVSIMGGAATTSLLGGAGDDTLAAFADKASVAGGEGKDVFSVMGGSDVTIVDYVTGTDSIFVDTTGFGKYTTISADGYDAKLNFSVEGGTHTLIIKDGTDKNITFTNGGEEFTAFKSARGEIDSNDPEKVTAITLDAGVTSFDANQTSYTNLASIDAHKVTVAGAEITANENVASYLTNAASVSGASLKLIGGKANDTLIAGTKGDTLDGGAGDDSLVGGAGNDVFVWSAGNDVIAGFTSTDSIKFGADASIASTAIDGDNLIFTLSNANKITLQDAFRDSVNSVAVNVFDSAGAAVSNYTYGKEGYVLGDDSVTLLSNFANDKGYVAAANIKNIVAQNTAATSIDASAVTGGVSIDGSAAGGNTFIGGAGNDQFTGAEGKADTFIYTAGKDVVTNYDSSDKVSLGAEFNFAKDLTGVAVSGNASVGTVKLAFGSGELTFENIAITDSVTGAINIADSLNTGGVAYTFANNIVGIGQEASVLAAGNYDLAAIKAYTTLTATAAATTLDASKVEDKAYSLTLNKGGAALGGKLDDTLTTSANASVAGGEGKDIFSVMGGSDVTIVDYVMGTDSIFIDTTGFGKYTTISAEGYDAKLSFSVEGGATNTLIIKDGTDKNIEFTNGGDSVTTAFVAARGNTDDNDPTKVTAITLDAGVTSFNANQTSYPDLKTIDAHQVTTSGASIIANNNNSYLTNEGNDKANLKLYGGTGNDMLVAGTKGDLLDGGAGNNSLVGGKGNDTFSVSEADSTTIEAFGSGDSINGTDLLFVDENFALNDATMNGSDFVLTFNDSNKVTFKGVDPYADGYKLKIQGGNDSVRAYTFQTDKITSSVVGGTAQEITLTSAYKGELNGKKTIAKFEDTNGIYSLIDASDLPKGNFTLIGGGSDKTDVKIIGGKGNDTLKASAKNDTFTGGAGADVFIYDGGNDKITDYKAGEKDKIVLDDFNVSDVKNFSVTMDSVGGTGTVNFGFKDGASLSVYVDEDMTAAKFKGITIADDANPKGVAYTFGTVEAGGKTVAQLVDSKAKSVTMFGGGEINFSTDDYKKAPYTSVKMTEAATLTAGSKVNNLTLGKGGELSVADGVKKATLTASVDDATTAASLTGSEKSKDFFVYDGGQVNIASFTAKDDTLAVADGWNIVGADASNGLTLTLSNDDVKEYGSVSVEGITTGQQFNLAAPDDKGKYKTTKAFLVSDDNNTALADNASLAKAKAVTVLGAEGDFSELDTSGKKPVSVYKSLVTITAGAAGANVVGNDKNNVITIGNGGTAAGGLGNDTYVIEGGNTEIKSFGIGAKTVYEGTTKMKLASKVSDTGKSGKSYAYDTDVTSSQNAQGKDIVKVDGTVLSVEVNGLDIGTTANTKHNGDNKGESTFEVKITVDADGDGKYTEGSTDYTVDLTNIVRDQTAKSNATFCKNTDFKDLSTIQIWDTSSGASKKLTWKFVKNSGVTLTNAAKDAVGVTPAATADAPSADLLNSDNFITGGASIDDVMNNDVATTAIGDLNAGSDTTGLGVTASSDGGSVIKRTTKK